MNKTVTITIQGMVFTVEEDAYIELKAYLEAIQNQFGSSEESKEVLQEIESRIAELFQEEILKDREVITKQDISQLKSIMGEVHDFIDQEDHQDQKQEEKKKRFYRDGDHKIIAGVASGIAAYLGVDPTLVRILLVVGLITGVLSGFVIILYLIIWLVTEEADTLVERMEMDGQPVTLHSIQNRVKETVQAGKELVDEKIHSEKVKKNSSKLKSGINSFFQLIGDLFWGFVKFLKIIGKVFGKVLGFVFLLGGVVAITGVSFLLGLLVFYSDSPLVDFPFEILGTTTEYYLLVISAGFIACVPLLFIVLLGIRFIKKQFVLPLSLFVIMLFLWGASIATAGVLAVKTIPDIQSVVKGNQDQALARIDDYAIINKEQIVEDFTRLSVQNDLNVVLEKGDKNLVRISGAKKDVEEVLINTTNGKLTIQKDRYFVFCIFCLRRPVDIVITTPMEVEEMQLSGSVTLSASDLSQSALALTTSGAVEVFLQGSITEVLLQQSGASEVTLNGISEIVNAQLSGGSELYALDFAIAQMNIEMSGGSEARIFVNDYLEIKGSGASELSYKGKPQIKESLSGAATIKQLLFEVLGEQEVLLQEN